MAITDAAMKHEREASVSQASLYSISSFFHITVNCGDSGDQGRKDNEHKGLGDEPVTVSN